VPNRSIRQQEQVCVLKERGRGKKFFEDPEEDKRSPDSSFIFLLYFFLFSLLMLLFLIKYFLLSVVSDCQCGGLFSVEPSPLPGSSTRTET